MDEKTESGRVSCGALDCGAVIPGEPESRQGHLREAHPDLYGTVYLPCPAPRGTA